MIKKQIVATSLVIGLLLPVNANAGFFDSMWEIPSEMMDLMSKLSDDIGLMADRILTMADKIGDMADRIVETERLMADTLVRMEEVAVGGTCTTETTTNPSTGTPAPTTSTPSTNNTVILQTIYGSTASLYRAPQIDISDNSDTYLLYVSESPTIDASNSSSFLVGNYMPIEKAWSDAIYHVRSNQVYIAVKTVDGDIVSNMSNVVQINLQ